MSNVEVHVPLVIEVTTKHCRSGFIKGQTLMANIFVKLAAKIDVFEIFFPLPVYLGTFCTDRFIS